MPISRDYLSNKPKELGSYDPGRKKVWCEYIILSRQEKVLYRDCTLEMSLSREGLDQVLKQQLEGHIIILKVVTDMQGLDGTGLPWECLLWQFLRVTLKNDSSNWD